jgi:hypothetical protein
VMGEIDGVDTTRIHLRFANRLHPREISSPFRGRGSGRLTRERWRQ